MQGQMKGQIKGWLAIAVVAVFAIATVFLTKPQGTTMSASPVSGLMTLKMTAAESVPYDVALADAAAMGKPMAIEFYANWCTVCQAIAPTMQALHKEWGDRINFVMIDIDNPEWREAIAQYHATGVPQLTLLQGNGEVLDSLVGRVPKGLLAQRLQMLVAEAV